jgi:protein TonB
MSALTVRQNNTASLGGLDLRRYSSRYLSLGLGISVAVHVMLLATYQIATRLLDHDTIPAAQPMSFDIILLPPPSISDIPGKPFEKIALPELPPVAIIPKPTPLEIEREEPVVPDQNELRQILNHQLDSVLIGLGNGQLVITEPLPVDDPVPPPSTFTPYEQAPRLIKSVQPEYPSMARSAAVPGKVWTKFYVDKRGEVREVAILKASPEGLGFEEETIKAIKQWKFTPALQNEQPVGVWVGQVIVFKIE